MTMDHTITPPPELVERLQDLEPQEAIREAYRAGADWELGASVAWLISKQNPRWALALQEGRRPKPKSQAEEALEALEAEDSRRLWSSKTEKRFDTIRAALERLRELENQ